MKWVKGDPDSIVKTFLQYQDEVTQKLDSGAIRIWRRNRAYGKNWYEYTEMLTD